ncbi:hypothetical protein Bbelb_087040 [Branchiostoma belcheri]|nr:hypothetical protein Bbelb_087040 [Branchiostoma belcheri]
MGRDRAKGRPNSWQSRWPGGLTGKALYQKSVSLESCLWRMTLRTQERVEGSLYQASGGWLPSLSQGQSGKTNTALEANPIPRLDPLPANKRRGADLGKRTKANKAGYQATRYYFELRPTKGTVSGKIPPQGTWENKIFLAQSVGWRYQSDRASDRPTTEGRSDPREGWD